MFANYEHYVIRENFVWRKNFQVRTQNFFSKYVHSIHLLHGFITHCRVASVGHFSGTPFARLVMQDSMARTRD